LNQFQRLEKGERAVRYSTLTNLILVIIKGVFGLLSGTFTRQMER